MNDLERLWEDHSSATFPAQCRELEIDGVDLTMLDTYAAGCVATFLGTSTLDEDTQTIIERCAQQIEQVLPRLEAGARPYFERLHELVETVIRQSVPG